MRILFIDLETTGFSRQWDYIIEIAAILYDTETKEEIDRFHEYIKPWDEMGSKIMIPEPFDSKSVARIEQLIDSVSDLNRAELISLDAKYVDYIKSNFRINGKFIPETPKSPITTITGISNYKVKDCRSEDDVVRDFLEFEAMAKPDAWCGHNIKVFDVQVLQAKSDKYFLDMEHPEIIDTLKIAREKKVPVTKMTKKGRPSYTQESVAGGYGIVYNAHSAIADVEANIQIYNKMHEQETTKQTKAKERNKLGF